MLSISASTNIGNMPKKFGIVIVSGRTYMKHEIKEITILRSLAILILMLTHFHDYVSLGWLWKIYPVCAHISLSLFVFISGYCLVLGTKITTTKNLFEFIKRKTTRIYILYLPALVLFLLLYKHSYSDKLVLFIDHLLGLQLFFAPIIAPYFTIWYIGLIVPFYLFYGFSCYLVNCFKIRFKTSFVLSIVYIALGILYIWLAFHKGLVVYFPAFIAGVFLSERGYFSHRFLRLKSYLFMLTLSIVLLLLFYICNLFTSPHFLFTALKTAIVVTYIIMIALSFAFVVHFIVLKTCTVHKFIDYISYASYAIYLFHRPILTVIQRGLLYLQIENAYTLLILYPVIIFPLIVLPVSYLLQKSADKAIHCFANKRLHQTAKGRGW